MSAESTAKLVMLILIASLLIMLYGVDRTHCLEVPAGNETDKFALLDFKKLIANDPNGALRSWNTTTTTPYCQWNGVNCSLKHPGRVTALDLSGYGLSGPISASLGNLTFLRTLHLSSNFFSGGLPPLNRLQRLYILVLRNNLLESTISDAITNCPNNLEALDLSRNLITGEIPSSLSIRLSKLRALQLSNSNLTGIIPSNLKNISQLLLLNLANNQLTGSIPSELGQLSSMQYLFLGGNTLTGGIPGTIFNLSYLLILDVTVNMLGGMELPSNIGDKLPRLAKLHMSQNMFQGHIPPSLGNASNLVSLDMSQNNFTGHIPSSFGNLGALTNLNLGRNNLQARDSQSWEFIDKLSHCRSLETLYLHANNLQGAIPNTIGNLSTSLTQLVLYTNNLSGTIPTSIGNLSGLTALQLANNNLNGTIEEWSGKLKNLQKLSLQTNNLIGPIPSSIGNLTQLLYLTLAENKFEGLIPPSLGSLPLLEVNLSYNNLNGSIPKEIFSSGSTMVKCILSYNNLQGSIPQEIGNLQQVTDLEFSSNNLTGEIPSALGRCVGLLVLQMDRNFLTGNISVSLGNLKSLSMLNLSHNNLSGFIPTDLSQLQNLTQLDLSYNSLQGKIPTTGVFGNARSVSLVGNRGLCGGVSDLHMPVCPTTTTTSRGGEKKYYLVKILIPIFGFMSLMVLGYFFIAEMKDKRAHSSSPPFGDKFLKVSYNDLAEATKNFSESNLIGSGSYGSVYRGNLKEDKLEVAVKVLDLDMRGAEKSFLSECEALRSIQHRNIVPIITACSTVQNGGEFKALVYGYMPNGNLDTWLHKKGDGEGPNHLSLAQRICIAVNIADALDYIHNDSGKPIIHCDVKPSNILLDDDMHARLGDFGIASFYHHSSSTTTGRDTYSTSSFGMKGTIGYIAPEYAGGGRPSTCGDVYSFGVLLLEMLTGKRPTDPMFENGLSIINFVERCFVPDQILQVIDASLKDECKAASSTVIHQCLLSLVEVALSCTRQFPSERMTMREAASRISAIKATHVKGKDMATTSLQR